MLSYSGISIGIEKQNRVSISQANPLELSEILLKIRQKAHFESTNIIYNYQMDYQYQYKYYLSKLSKYDDLEYKVVVELSSLMPEARYRIDLSAGFILKNYLEEEIYYSQYPIPQNINPNEILVFRNYTLFLSLRRSLLELRKKIWRLYSMIETKKKVLKVWEQEYWDAFQEKLENERIYALSTNDFSSDAKECAEKLRQIRLKELKEVKELQVLNYIEDDEYSEELEKKYSDDESANNGCCLKLLNKRRATLYRSKSEDPPLLTESMKGNTIGINSIIPDSLKIKKELKKLPPRPEKSDS